MQKDGMRKGRDWQLKDSPVEMWEMVIRDDNDVPVAIALGTHKHLCEENAFAICAAFDLYNFIKSGVSEVIDDQRSYTQDSSGIRTKPRID